MKALGIIFGGLSVVIFLLALAWVGMGNELLLYRYFAPRTETVRREVFEESKAYRQGMVQELQGRAAAYAAADAAHRTALGALILHEVADYDIATLPPYLQEFIVVVRKEQLQ